MAGFQWERCQPVYSLQGIIGRLDRCISGGVLLETASHVVQPFKRDVTGCLPDILSDRLSFCSHVEMDQTGPIALSATGGRWLWFKCGECLAEPEGGRVNGAGPGGGEEDVGAGTSRPTTVPSTRLRRHEVHSASFPPADFYSETASICRPSHAADGRDALARLAPRLPLPNVEQEQNGDASTIVDCRRSLISKEEGKGPRCRRHPSLSSLS